jgi:hypothetical protein
LLCIAAVGGCSGRREQWQQQQQQQQQQLALTSLKLQCPVGWSVYQRQSIWHKKYAAAVLGSSCQVQQQAQENVGSRVNVTQAAAVVQQSRELAKPRLRVAQLQQHQLVFCLECYCNVYQPLGGTQPTCGPSLSCISRNQ